MLRNLHALPKSSTKRPWVVRQNYFADAIDFHFLDKIEEDMSFGRVGQPLDVVPATRVTAGHGTRNTIAVGTAAALAVGALAYARRSRKAG